MDDLEHRVAFERPMPIEHRVVYGLFGGVALYFAAWVGRALFEHLDEAWQGANTSWAIFFVLLLFGLPLIAAAVLGGSAEVSANRATRELREVAWVGPVPAWRQSHPFKDVGVPLVIQSRGGKAPKFKIEIPVKDRATVPLAYFPTRAEAEGVAQAIRAAVSSDDLPPFQRSSTDRMKARLAAIFLQGPRGPLG